MDHPGTSLPWEVDILLGLDIPATTGRALPSQERGREAAATVAA